MKKIIFTIIPSLFLGLMASAQLELSGQSYVYYGTSSIIDEEVDAAWEVINSSDFPVLVSASRLAIEEVEGADGNFCWGLLCIAWSTGNYNASSEQVYMEPGEVNNSFKAKYRHHGHPGAATYRYCFYEVDNQVPTVCHTVTYAVDVEVGVNDVPAVGGEIEVFPNPIENLGTVSYRFNQAPSNGKMVIYNALGAKVKEIGLKNQQGVVYVGGSEFTSGVYFCSIEDNGVTHETVRIIFQ
ncbi:MAG TPA: T9SS type A sorting domain-containing protein [Flavobacteriales bacterium]